MSFVIRATNNPTTSWSNWPVRVIVHRTNAWRIEPKRDREFFTCQASNEFGISEPAACSTNRPAATPERLFTRREVAVILQRARETPAPTPPPLPTK